MVNDLYRMSLLNCFALTEQSSIQLFSAPIIFLISSTVKYKKIPLFCVKIVSFYVLLSESCKVFLHIWWQGNAVSQRTFVNKIRSKVTSYSPPFILCKVKCLSNVDLRLFTSLWSIAYFCAQKFLKIKRARRKCILFACLMEAFL